MARKGNLQVVTPFSPHIPPAPSHLLKESTTWWNSICAAYDLDEAALELLRLAAEALDRVREARAIICKDGLMVKLSGGGSKVHPMLAVERDSRLAAARLIRELNLDIEPADVRPPSRGSARRGR